LIEYSYAIIAKVRRQRERRANEIAPFFSQKALIESSKNARGRDTLEDNESLPNMLDIRRRSSGWDNLFAFQTRKLERSVLRSIVELRPRWSRETRIYSSHRAFHNSNEAKEKRFALQQGLRISFASLDHLVKRTRLRKVE